MSELGNNLSSIWFITMFFFDTILGSHEASMDSKVFYNSLKQKFKFFNAGIKFLTTISFYFIY